MLGKRKSRLIKKKVKFKGKWRINKEVVVKDEGVSPLVKKYWVQRYDLFLRYDQGIKMDEEGWFSVTPEKIARRHARRCGGGVVIDGFAGVGGNAIQFATMCHHVIAIDIDPRKIALAFENAKIYGVEDHIEFIVGDFFQLAPSLKGNVVFLSPPWGGPAYSTKESFTLDLLKPKNGTLDAPDIIDDYYLNLLDWGSSNVLSIALGGTVYLWDATNGTTSELVTVDEENGPVTSVKWAPDGRHIAVGLNNSEVQLWDTTIEKNKLHGRLKSITAYFGDIALSDSSMF